MNRKPAIDLTRNHFLRPYGDLVLVGTWLFNADQDDYEPCLVIVPRYRKSGFKPCCVALSAAFRYWERPAYVALAAKTFAAQLGMTDCAQTTLDIGNLILDNLGELLKMPPNPTQSIIVADASYTVDGKTHSAVILDHQPLAQA